jgi:hypothetical protein
MKFLLLLITLPFLALAQPTQPNVPSSPLQPILTEGAFDSTIRNQVNYNYWALENLPSADAASIYSIRVCSTLPTNGQALVYNAAGNCWVPGASGGGGFTNPSIFPGVVDIPGPLNVGYGLTGAAEIFSMQLCDTSCTHPAVLASLATGPGATLAGSFQLSLPTTVAVIGTTCTSGQLGTVNVVTDATSPTVGSQVAGSGSAKAQVWCNGSQWSVTGQ